MPTKAVAFVLWVWSRINSRPKVIKRMIKVNKIKESRGEDEAGGGGGGGGGLCTYGSQQQDTAELQRVWGCSTSGTSPPDQFKPDLSEHRGEEAENSPALT